MMKKTVIILFTLVATITLSCSKEDNQSPPTQNNNNNNNNNNNPPTKKELLTSKDWKLTALTFTAPSSSQPVDDYKFPDCYKDNLYKFNSDESYKIDEGPSKCNPSDPQTYSSGTWEFSNNETVINITTNKLFQFEIIDLNETTLRLSLQDGQYKYTYTYKHP